MRPPSPPGRCILSDLLRSRCSSLRREYGSSTLSAILNLGASSIGYGIAARNSNACDVTFVGGARLKTIIAHALFARIKNVYIRISDSFNMRNNYVVFEFARFVALVLWAAVLFPLVGEEAASFCLTCAPVHSF